MIRFVHLVPLLVLVCLSQAAATLLGQPLPVNLEWDANSEPDLAGYNLYRSNQSGSGYVRLNGSLITGTSYTDSDIQEGRTYYYVCTAVNDADLESSFSNEASKTIP